MIHFTLTEPGRARIERFLAQQKHRAFTYAPAGATRAEQAPPGYRVDRNRVQLGEGAAIFERAKEAVRGWKMFDTGWTHLHHPDAPIEPETTVALTVRHFGFWSLHACRIVYTIDEPLLFGFAYGTLPGHAAAGEERFTVQLEPLQKVVSYEIYAFSRPKSIARLMPTAARAVQKRFAAASLGAMTNYCRQAAGTTK